MKRPVRLELPFAHAAALHDFDRAQRILNDKYSLEISVTGAPETVFHYTTAFGMQGIIESGQFWLNDIRTMNDPSEIRHALEVAIDGLRRTPAYEQLPQLRQFAEDVFTLGLRGVENGIDFFIFSLSKHENDLSQWRLYADNARGFALEFDIRNVEQAFAKEYFGNGSCSVTYNDERLRVLQRPLLDSLPRLLQLAATIEHNPAMLRRYLHELQLAAVVPILSSAVSFKHPAYHGEQEYRLMTGIRRDQSDDKTLVRERAGQSIRYRILDWRRADPKALRRVWIGPGAHKENGRQLAAECVAR